MKTWWLEGKDGYDKPLPGQKAAAKQDNNAQKIPFIKD